MNVGILLSAPPNIWLEPCLLVCSTGKKNPQLNGAKMEFFSIGSHHFLKLLSWSAYFSCEPNVHKAWNAWLFAFQIARVYLERKGNLDHQMSTSFLDPPMVLFAKWLYEASKFVQEASIIHFSLKLPMFGGRVQRISRISPWNYCWWKKSCTSW